MSQLNEDTIREMFWEDLSENEPELMPYDWPPEPKDEGVAQVLYERFERYKNSLCETGQIYDQEAALIDL